MASDFGKRLKAAREHAGLTQEQLRQRAGAAQSTLAAAEASGEGSRLTAQFAYHCGVNAYWLATGEGDMLAGVTQAPIPQSRRVRSPELADALPVVLGRLAGLSGYRAGQVLHSLQAATHPGTDLEQIERDLLQWLDEPDAVTAPAKHHRKA